MPRELFHYCSNDKCFNILKYKNIRLSDIRKSNDNKELVLYFPEIFDLMEEIYKEKPFKFKYEDLTGKEAFNKILDDSYFGWRAKLMTGRFSSFVLCFSEDGDSLSQWRGYANNAKGCCIGFSYRQLNEYCRKNKDVLRLEKVNYLNEKEIYDVTRDAAKKIVDGLIGMREWLVENMTHNDESPKTDGLLGFNFDGMVESMFIDSLRFKAKAFQEEKEWRIFLNRPAYKNPDWLIDLPQSKILGPQGFAETIAFLRDRFDFLITEDDMIPYCPINFREFLRNPVASINIGPKSKIRPIDLELFLKANGYDKVKIHQSSISYN